MWKEWSPEQPQINEKDEKGYALAVVEKAVSVETSNLKTEVTSTLEVDDMHFPLYNGITQQDVQAAINTLKTNNPAKAKEMIPLLKKTDIIAIQKALGMIEWDVNINNNADGKFGRKTLANLAAGKVVEISIENKKTYTTEEVKDLIEKDTWANDKIKEKIIAFLANNNIPWLQEYVYKERDGKDTMNSWTTNGRDGELWQKTLDAIKALETIADGKEKNDDDLKNIPNPKSIEKKNKSTSKEKNNKWPEKTTQKDEFGNEIRKITNINQVPNTKRTDKKVYYIYHSSGEIKYQFYGNWRYYERKDTKWDELVAKWNWKYEVVNTKSITKDDIKDQLDDQFKNDTALITAIEEQINKPNPIILFENSWKYILIVNKKISIFFALKDAVYAKSKIIYDDYVAKNKQIKKENEALIKTKQTDINNSKILSDSTHKLQIENLPWIVFASQQEVDEFKQKVSTIIKTYWYNIPRTVEKPFLVLRNNKISIQLQENNDVWLDDYFQSLCKNAVTANAIATFLNKMDCRYDRKKILSHQDFTS